MGANAWAGENATDKSSAFRITAAILGLAALLTVLAPALILHVRSSGEPVFWDAHVYARAIDAFQTGGDPYVRNSALTFVYPPIFLLLANAPSRLVHAELAWQLYLITSVLALLSVPFLMAEAYFRSRWFSAGIAVVLFLVHPLFTGLYACATGNIANILYPLLFAAAVPGILRNQWLPFHLALVLAACIKLPMLSFLLLPLLLGQRQLIRCSLTACAVLAVDAAQRFAQPAAWHAYLQAVRYQVLDRGSVGLGVFPAVLHRTQHVALLPAATPLLAHTLLFGALAAGMAWARANGALRQAPRWFIALTLLLALMANPRMVAYDLAMLVVPMTFLLGDMVRYACSPKVTACVLLGLFCCWFLCGSFALVACYIASLLCFPLAAFAWRKAHATQRSTAACPVHSRPLRLRLHSHPSGGVRQASAGLSGCDW